MWPLSASELGIDSMVVVGHSMGGTVAAALAAFHPQLVVAAVGVDSALMTSPGAVQRLTPRIDAMAGADYLKAALEMVDAMFLPCDDPTRRAAITEGMTSVPQHTMVSAMRGNLAQTPETLGTISQPFLMISAGWVPVDTAFIRQTIPNLRYAQTYGSGHFSMLEVPDQVNAMIERFLALELAEAPVGLAES